MGVSGCEHTAHAFHKRQVPLRETIILFVKNSDALVDSVNARWQDHTNVRWLVICHCYDCAVYIKAHRLSDTHSKYISPKINYVANESHNPSLWQSHPL